jgi:hypothetical protein
MQNASLHNFTSSQLGTGIKSFPSKLFRNAVRRFGFSISTALYGATEQAREARPSEGGSGIECRATISTILFRLQRKLRRRRRQIRRGNEGSDRRRNDKRGTRERARNDGGSKQAREARPSERATDGETSEKPSDKRGMLADRATERLRRPFPRHLIRPPNLLKINDADFHLT